ncbi:hypothetical protein SAMN05421783_10285 [Thiocapsa roseopersicina]|uniref:Uncharacterized protein n=1 Tax=Thiocapsa roseopersicina TaxID=1058 RepID=A0A1H2RM34_THIRO|nr:hypothetical protein SAMN05421783_10285 [Thiocapsa roseopersicina]
MRPDALRGLGLRRLNRTFADTPAFPLNFCVKAT